MAPSSLRRQMKELRLRDIVWNTRDYFFLPFLSDGVLYPDPTSRGAAVPSGAVAGSFGVG